MFPVKQKSKPKKSCSKSHVQFATPKERDREQEDSNKNKIFPRSNLKRIQKPDSDSKNVEPTSQRRYGESSNKPRKRESESSLDADIRKSATRISSNSAVAKHRQDPTLTCGAHFASMEKTLDLNNNEVGYSDDVTDVDPTTGEIFRESKRASRPRRKMSQSEPVRLENSVERGAESRTASTTSIDKKQALVKAKKPSSGSGFTEVLFRQLRPYLNPIEIHTCCQVSRQWREFCDTICNPPRIFNGRKSTLNMCRSKFDCRMFLQAQLLSSENKRRFQLRFHNVNNWQMRTMISERAEDFTCGVRHMTKLHLVNCNLRWDTLANLLSSLSHLNTFTDTWSCHYQYASCCCGCGPHKNQGPATRMYDKLPLAELKKLMRLRFVKVERKSLSKEICIYLQILSRMGPHVEEFELIIGPWESSSQEKIKVSKCLPSFENALQGALTRMRRYLKSLRITLEDKSFSCLFDTCVDSIYTIDFQRLRELKLTMNVESLRAPTKLPEFGRFMNQFEWKEGQRFYLLRAHISQIHLTKEWTNLLSTMYERILRRKSRVSLRLGVALDDSQNGFSERSRTILNAFSNPVFVRGLSGLQINIVNEQTVSLKQVIPSMRLALPNVQSVDIRIGERESGKDYAFRDYSIFSIAANFGFITQLRISDQPPRTWDILDFVIGKTDRASLTYAYISAREMVLLCETLLRLQILQLHANLNDIRDVHFTGIRPKFYIRHPEDGQLYVRKGEVMMKHNREPSIYNLQQLRVLSLRGLGMDVTDITCRFAFHGMSKLKFIELIGDTNITQKGRSRLNTRMRQSGCQLNVWNHR